jgi:hypothetical protein
MVQKRRSHKGGFREATQSVRPFQINFRKIELSFFRNVCSNSVHPAPHEGRFAIVTDVDAGCDGRIGRD